MLNFFKRIASGIEMISIALLCAGLLISSVLLFKLMLTSIGIKAILFFLLFLTSTTLAIAILVFLGTIVEDANNFTKQKLKGDVNYVNNAQI